jgi:hypothetical protein
MPEMKPTVKTAPMVGDVPLFWWVFGRLWVVIGHSSRNAKYLAQDRGMLGGVVGRPEFFSPAGNTDADGRDNFLDYRNPSVPGEVLVGVGGSRCG